MHVDPDLLALLALGERSGTEGDHRHLESCADCSIEVSQLRRLVKLGRSVSAEAAIATPRQGVWAMVRDELGLDTSLEPHEVAQVVGDVTGSRPDAEVIGHARLSPVEALWSHASGRADLVTDADGRRVLELELRADLPTTGIRQAWLVHRNDPNLRQTLGILDGPLGLWTVERSIDLSSFGILDISQQGTGETNHSGQTIVRGELILAN